ncbi:hypothetical protein QBZ16_002090 [Prototheca wickerhamii]|uniref:RNA polymerase II-associated protein 1 n=1 Tax=Prototheca wickerhamii TaxID=3111 RepID=A0AAD9MLG7_PROWI|nr:hypothetical protein QBZ16_002090 [Prototheca wickerhamii]
MPEVGPSGADLAARVPAPAPGSVEEESLAMLGSMTTDDVQEAQQELRERLKPETLAFLRKRALLKKAPAQGDPKQPPPPAVSAAPAERKPTTRPPATAAPASSATGSLPTIARLRFDAQGLIIGLSPADAAPEDAVRRSPLGGEESMQAGLTLREAAALTRSSSSAHRVAALGTLRAVLTKLSQRGSLGDSSIAALQAADLSNNVSKPLIESLASVSTDDVQREALCGARVTVTLRRALDDRNLHVMAAAAGALRALLDLAPAAWQRLEACLASPLLGLPLPAVRRAHRLHGPASAWATAPLRDEDAARPGAARAQHEKASPIDDEIEEDNWEALGLVDPLSAVIGMGLLDRASYILSQTGIQSQAVTDLLAILRRVAVMGPDAVLMVATHPDLPRALAPLLSSDAAPGTRGVVPGTRAAQLLVGLLDVLCAVAPRAVTPLVEAGLLRWVAPTILLADAAEMNNQAATQTSGSPDVLIAALRIWQASASLPPGTSAALLSLEDALPVIRRALDHKQDSAVHASVAAAALWAATALAAQRRRAVESALGAHASGAALAAIQRETVGWLLQMDPAAAFEHPERVQATAAGLVLAQGLVHADGPEASALCQTPPGDDETALRLLGVVCDERVQATLLRQDLDRPSSSAEGDAGGLGAVEAYVLADDEAAPLSAASPEGQDVGSMLPLPSGWLALLPTSGIKTAQGQAKTPLDLALPAALGLALLTGEHQEVAARPQVHPLQTYTLSILQTVFLAESRDDHAPIWQERWARKLLAVALQTLRDRRQGDLAILMPMARALARAFAADSFGDRLYAAFASLLFQRRVAPDVQAEAFYLLGEGGALGLLPPLESTPTGPALALGGVEESGAQGKAEADATFYPLDQPLPGSGRRSVRSGALPYALVLHRLARALDGEPPDQAAALGAMVRGRVQDARLLEQIQHDLARWDVARGRLGDDVFVARARDIYGK